MAAELAGLNPPTGVYVHVYMCIVSITGNNYHLTCSYVYIHNCLHVYTIHDNVVAISLKCYESFSAARGQAKNGCPLATENIFLTTCNSS